MARIALAILKHLAAPAPCAGNPFGPVLLVRSTRGPIQQVTHSSESVRLPTETEAVSYVLVGLRLPLIRPTPIVTLSERSELVCIRSLGRSAEQWRRQAGQPDV